MNWKILFHRETQRAETSKQHVDNLTPADYFSEPCIDGLRTTLNKIGINVQKIDKI